VGSTEPLIAHILLRNRIAPDAGTIVGAIEKAVRISSIESREFPVRLNANDLEITVDVVERPCALPRLRQAGIHTDNWPTAIEETSQHQAYLLISVSPAMPLASHLVLTMCVNSCLGVAAGQEPAIAVHWAGSEAIYRSDVFAGMTKEMFATLWSTVWFFDHVHPTMEKMWLICTRGLKTFNGLDIECLVRPEESLGYVKLLCKCAVDTIGARSPLPDGERLQWPLGPTGETCTVELRRLPSVIEPATNVIRIVHLAEPNLKFSQ
jgi:hypothetical protein